MQIHFNYYNANQDRGGMDTIAITSEKSLKIEEEHFEHMIQRNDDGDEETEEQ